MTVSLVLPAGRSHAGFALAFVGLVLAVAVAGGAIAVGAFTGGEGAGHADVPSVGEPIDTSFGSMTFERVSTIGGLTPEELGGVTHGIQNLVLTGQAQVEVSVRVANRGDHRIAVVPDQFTLTVAGSADPVPMVGSTIKPLQLEPGATVEATLTYVVPQSGAAMSVAYADPGGGVIAVEAGQLDLVSPDPGHAH